ncbi:hypothetical protein AAEO56_12545 [Flavobacterium sp. DGU11]|uniref:TMF family protein n=1 Tax=Flavobacterium arundinis TaxID=3139143 RepID=A0ABU9HY76_9FLAO
MKTRIFLGMGLLVSVIGFGQTYNAGTGSGPGGGTDVHVGTSAGAVMPAGSATTGFSTFIGYQAGMANTAGYNTMVGYKAGTGNVTGVDNCFFGAGAGVDATGSRNIFIGRLSGQQSTGDKNVFVGQQSGIYAGTNNVGLGDHAGYTNASGSSNNENAYLGSSAGQSSIGSYNVMLGFQAGFGVSGDSNVFIGYNAGHNLGEVDDILFIENSTKDIPLIYGDFSLEELKFNAKKVGIGFEGTSGNEGFGDFPALTGLENADKYRLFVRGGILAEEVRIRLHEDWIWPDYVFAKDYNLLSLKDTEKYILENGHLPNMPSAEKVKAEGVELGNMVTLQQEKIEELTLHLIEQEKQIEELKAQNARLEELEAKVELLLNKQ